jgi:hypothetical protein
MSANAQILVGGLFVNISQLMDICCNSGYINIVPIIEVIHTKIEENT